MSGLRITAIRLLCPDPAATAAFYARAFRVGREVSDAGVAVRFGALRLEFAQADGAAGPHEPAPSNSTSFQHCAIVVSDMSAAYAHLLSIEGWTAISRAGPECLPASSGGVDAFKFRDPDGHPLELLHFPQGAIPEHWCEAAGLFLGIDHTAITVVDTERSVSFYEGLGFGVLSRGLNRGIEQARLDGVGAPVVEVTGLCPPGGAPPHLELLCYREPDIIRAAVPVGDVLATRTRLSAGGDEPSRIVEQTDPDGHRLAFEEAE